MMPRGFYAQTTVTAAQEAADKLLGANFLSLALFALILVIGMFILFVWLEGKRQARDAQRQDANDNRQDAFLKTVVGENSPLVAAQNRVAAVLEKSEDQAAKRTDALLALGQKTDHQTEVINKTLVAIEDQTKVISAQTLDQNNYQVLVSDNLHNHGLRIEQNTESIAALKMAIDDIPNQMRLVLGEQTLRSEAVQLITTLRDEIMAYIRKEQAKRGTGTYPAVNDADSD